MLMMPSMTWTIVKLMDVESVSTSPVSVALLEEEEEEEVTEEVTEEEEEVTADVEVETSPAATTREVCAPVVIAVASPIVADALVLVLAPAPAPVVEDLDRDPDKSRIPPSCFFSPSRFSVVVC